MHILWHAVLTVSKISSLITPVTCSDNSFGTIFESHVEDYCRIRQYGTEATDVPYDVATMKVVCEREASYQCPFGWAFYVDTGAEGHNSCVWIGPSPANTWAEAASSCPAGSHLLTIESSDPNSGLLPFATSLYRQSAINTGARMYIGCRCVFAVAVRLSVCS